MTPKPKIIFLDASSVDLGDIDLSLLKKQGLYQAFPNLRFTEISQKACQAHVIIVNKFLINETFLEKLPHLKLICVAATGYNNVDLAALKKRNIALANVAGYSTQTVAEHTLLFLLAISHRLLEHHEASLNGDWTRSEFFACLDFPFCDLAGKTLGIIGYGHIGKKVAKLARAFGMKVLIAQIPGLAKKTDPVRTPLKKLLQTSDYISLHCPLSPLTQNLINEKTLACVKQGAALINMARGPVVDETALAGALKKGSLAYYASDVTSHEPIPKEHPFFDKKIKSQLLLTPHIAWASKESRQRLMNEIAQNIQAFKAGKKRNRII